MKYDLQNALGIGFEAGEARQLLLLLLTEQEKAYADTL
jgi:hypothetical protein